MEAMLRNVISKFWNIEYRPYKRIQLPDISSGAKLPHILTVNNIAMQDNRNFIITFIIRQIKLRFVYNNKPQMHNRSHECELWTSIFLTI